MGEVVAHVVPAEGQHREWVATELTESAERGGSRLGTHRGRDEDAVLPIAGFEHERHRGGPPAPEEEGERSGHR